jgi:hypothetical protein
MRFKILFLVLLVWASSACAQNETRLGADFRGEGTRFGMSCGEFSILSCAELLFTDHPLHIAVGSIAPENGFGAGAAFVYHATPNESWRLSWDVDAIGSINGSWRAGFYMKGIFTGKKEITSGKGRPVHPPSLNPANLKRPYFDLYAQAISLNKIDYFGLGPATSAAGRSFYGMREIIPGVDGTFPIPAAKWVNLSLYGEANGRFVNIRGAPGQPSPSIEQLYTNATAPGLADQPAFVQFGEGIRLQPSYGDHFKLNYFVALQEFLAPGNSQFSFRRFMVDLSHEFPIYSTTRSLLPKDHNGPDDCSQGADDHVCPAITHNREGTIAVRLLISESVAPAGHGVPFYFQPTLGGNDLDGNPSLASYQDYRFRAPNVIVLRETFEHSIYGPLGFSIGVDEGKVALVRDSINFADLAHSYSAGLTLRAGGFPQVFVMFAWGGKEGTHTIGSMNTSLLGGGARPSLY